MRCSVLESESFEEAAVMFETECSIVILKFIECSVAARIHLLIESVWKSKLTVFLLSQ